MTGRQDEEDQLRAMRQQIICNWFVNDLCFWDASLTGAPPELWRQKQEPTDQQQRKKEKKPKATTTTSSAGSTKTPPQEQQQKHQDALQWQSAVDPNTRKTYYYNLCTGETTWKKPAEIRRIEKQVIRNLQRQQRKEFFKEMENNLLVSLHQQNQVIPGIDGIPCQDNHYNPANMLNDNDVGLAFTHDPQDQDCVSLHQQNQVIPEVDGIPCQDNHCNPTDMVNDNAVGLAFTHEPQDQDQDAGSTAGSTAFERRSRTISVMNEHGVAECMGDSRYDLFHGTMNNTNQIPAINSSVERDRAPYRQWSSQALVTSHAEGRPPRHGSMRSHHSPPKLYGNNVCTGIMIHAQGQSQQQQLDGKVVHHEDTFNQMKVPNTSKMSPAAARLCLEDGFVALVDLPCHTSTRSVIPYHQNDDSRDDQSVGRELFEGNKNFDASGMERKEPTIVYYNDEGNSLDPNDDDIDNTNDTATNENCNGGRMDDDDDRDGMSVNSFPHMNSWQHQCSVSSASNQNLRVQQKHTITNPDVKATIRCVCGVYQAHINQGWEKQQKDKRSRRAREVEPYLARLFRDEGTTGPGLSPNGEDDAVAAPGPSLEEIVSFFQYYYQASKMQEDTIIMTLMYLERVINYSRGTLSPNPDNWKSLLLSCMILASKVGDDFSMWNVDFSDVSFGFLGGDGCRENNAKERIDCSNGRRQQLATTFSLQRINELEVALLTSLQFNVRISASEYAKYYFLIRNFIIRARAKSQNKRGKKDINSKTSTKRRANETKLKTQVLNHWGTKTSTKQMQLMEKCKSTSKIRKKGETSRRLFLGNKIGRRCASADYLFFSVLEAIEVPSLSSLVEWASSD